MTPAEKDNVWGMMVSSFCDPYVGRIPSRVALPARNVKKKGIRALFIIYFMTFLEFLCIFFYNIDMFGGMNMNYQLEMEKQMEEIPEGEKLLLHVCCAPCSSTCLERLANHFQVVLFYYNPNISEEEEYQKRLDELKRFVSSISMKYPIQILEGKYEPEKFQEMAKGLEEEPERGKRCFLCYQMRLTEAAKVADLQKIPYFCTTLTLSPHKNVNWLNEIGELLDHEYHSHYLYSDFKKKGGYQRSIELSLKYHLYRQDYCGCIYSKKNKKEE